ncbi:MAG: chemotaxis response regulator protein-glutamate methylesterase, partial [Planctomycetes bacterium]|nr:chemotaxis response regulator protein-glutamate methylesterase [Planctomycetota bacterium]
AGAHLLAQDEATSTVYGMPRGPVEAGIARATPLSAMAAAIDAAARGVVCS